VEGEVQYADFIYWNSLISLWIVSRTKERSDVYAEIIKISDVNISK
jgi:hypothetical protein